MRNRSKEATFLIVFTLLLSLFLPTSHSAQKITAGASCKSLNKKVDYKNKTYTCIKRGNKLVWSKGVAIKSAAPAPIPTPTPTPSASPSPTSSAAPAPTPTPTPTPEPQLPSEGSQCPVIGQKISNSSGTMRCSWGGHATTTEEAKQKLQWRKLVVPKVSTSKSNNYPSIPVENAACSNSGDTFDVANGVLECRWIAGMRLQWIKINTVKKTFTNAKSPVSIDVCKLQMSASKADRTGRNAGGGMVGFPLVDSAKNGMLINGVNEVLIVPIDFPDFPGDSSLKAQLEYDKKWLNDWYDYFSGGKSKFNVTTIDSWLRMPKERSGYPTDSKNINPTAADSVQRQAVQAQPFVDEISKKVDLSKFSTVYVFFPEGEYALSDFIIRNYPFKTKEGVKNLNYFSWGRNLTGMETLKWSFYIHETLHDFNIIGHAPGNGWPLGIMTNQSGISYAINPWEQFLLDWLPPDQIYCDDAATLKPVTLSLSPMEREDKQTKMAVIKLSPTRAIVVESHGIDKWSSFNFADRGFPPGFYSVMAYIIDLDKQVAAPVNSDGSSQLNDEWAWAVWQKIVGTPSNQFFIPVGDRKSLQDYVAVLGDSFEIEGIRIKFVATGDYETIEISKVG
jgi:M6 family metalloprotease-like protein